MKVSVEHSAQMAALKEVGKPMRDIQKLFPMYSKATIYRHANKKLGQPSRIDRRKFNKGRPVKLTERDRRSILRAIPQLRESDGSFSSKRVATHTNLLNVSNRTIRRCMNKAGYGYYQSRKKGLMSAADRIKRVTFCRKVKNLKCNDFWKHHVSMFIDGVGFQFKTKPLDQARAPTSREWRLKSEGLTVTMKGKKEGCVNANFMVGMSYGCGVILCEQYRGCITGEKMKKIINVGIVPALEQSVAPRTRRILQDGCPRQNCKAAIKEFDRHHIKVFKIPPRSPDLNPIENLFHTMKKRLRIQALEEQIEYETFEQFSLRVKQQLLNVKAEDVDKIIDSMNKRVDDVLRTGGYRTKY